MFKLSTFAVTMFLSTTVFAGGDLLSDRSYVNENENCWNLVKNFAQQSIPGGKEAVVVPLSHISITQGTYNQTFISVINVNDDYYTLVSDGSFSCDELSLVSVQKISLGSN